VLTDLPFATFIQNAALLLAVAVVFDTVAGGYAAPETPVRKVLSGALLAIIGLTIMLTPFQFAPGLSFDSRAAFLPTVGLFFGAVPGAIAAGAMSAFRILQGGGGAASGVAVIWVALALGLAWRRLRRGELADQSPLELWLFGLVSVGLIMVVVAVGLFATVPGETAGTALRLITVPLIAVSPVAVALLGSLLVNRLQARRLAATNERLQAEVEAQLEEVRASRARIVEAADAERKRVERDLHDGAQQRLVSLSLLLRLARSKVGPDADPALGAALADATDAAKATLAELRELARGIHPQILTEAGLGPAIESLAHRSTLAVEVDAAIGRYPPVVEATAYFVVSEALANAAKYAEPSRVAVRVHELAGRLVVEVVDDGVGGAAPAGGTGLRGLTDRLAAIGGTLDVHSPTGKGTRLVGRIPVATEKSGTAL
jgi:signal transduction histidine kinase